MQTVISLFLWHEVCISIISNEIFSWDLVCIVLLWTILWLTLTRTKCIVRTMQLLINNPVIHLDLPLFCYRILLFRCVKDLHNWILHRLHCSHAIDSIGLDRLSCLRAPLCLPTKAMLSPFEIVGVILAALTCACDRGPSVGNPLHVLLLFPNSHDIIVFLFDTALLLDVGAVLLMDGLMLITSRVFQNVFNVQREVNVL